MLRLTSLARSPLKSRFICAQCRVLLASAAATTTLPGVVAKLCATRRHFSTTEQLDAAKKPTKLTRKARRSVKAKPKSKAKPAAPAESSSSESSSKPSKPSKPPSTPSRLQLWRETLQVLKEIKSDKRPPQPVDAPQDAQPETKGKKPGEAQLLEGALTTLQKALRQEVGVPPPPPAKTTKSTANKKTAAAAPKLEKAAAPEKPKRSLAEALGFGLPKADRELAEKLGGGAAKAAEKPAEKPATKGAAGKPKPSLSAAQSAATLVGLQPFNTGTGFAKGKKKESKEGRPFIVNSIDASRISLHPIEKPQPPVPRLAYGLDRVLFNPGVYHIQDPRSRVFNFDPYLERIMPVKEFDFNAIKQYVTSSKDTTLIQTAAEHKKKYTGSTSSMTSTLAHFHYLLSSWRPINPCMMSRNFEIESYNFTRIMRAPSATFLHWKDGTYAIDADKEFDTANILSMLGKSMEKFLTLPKEDFEKYRKSNSDQLTEEERNGPESFHYTTLGDFMMRSQLDAHDPRLPGTGMFDLKTRAVISIRMDAREFQKGMGYEIRKRFGQWESFEREYYDMIRSAFLKYSLQVRMGRMDGIFVAYHNTERIFGFQYIPLEEMDLSLHGQSDMTLGDREFKLSVHLLNKVLDRVTAKYPGRSLRLHFETRGEATPFMYIFAKPVTPTEIEEIQGANRAKVEEFEREMMGVISEEERALQEEDGAEEAVEEADEEDLDEVEGEEGEAVTSSAAWEDVMLKVEDELEDEEHGVTFVREAIEDALQESGLLRNTAPDDTQRYIDAFLEALTNNGRPGESDAAESAEDAAEEQVPEESEAEESSVEVREDIPEPETTPRTTEEGEESREAQEEDRAPSTDESSPDEPTLKDLIVKLAAQIRTVPTEKRHQPVEAELEEDAPAHALRLRKIERILSELKEQPQEEEEGTEESAEEGAEESEGNTVIETGTVTVQPGEPAESAAPGESAEPAESVEDVESVAPVEPSEPVEAAGAAEEGEKADEQPAEPAEPEPAATPSQDGTTPAPEQQETAPTTTTTQGFSTKGFVDEADDGGELYGLVLTIRNKVDGQYVVRPENLRPKQRWTVEYAIEEVNPDRAHNLYKMVLKRRKNLLYPEAPGDRDKWHHMFQGRLEQYSSRGRRFRQRENRRQRQQPVHVYGSDQPVEYQAALAAGRNGGGKASSSSSEGGQGGDKKGGE